MSEANIGHQLLFLSNHGEGVLIRLYSAVKLNITPRPDQMNPNHKEFGRVIKKILDSYPSEPKEDIEKLVGYDSFRSHDLSLKRYLTPIYEPIVEMIDFRNALQALIPSISKILVLSWKYNPLILSNLMNCVQLYLRMCALLNELVITDVKSCVGVFAHVSKLVDHAPRSDFAQVTQMMSEVEKYLGLKHIWTLFSDMQGRLQDAICELCSIYWSTNDTKNIRQQGLLNVLHTQQGATQPLPSEKYELHLIKEDVEIWIILGVLCCPSVLTKETIFDKFKDVLSNHYCICVCRDITLPIHELFDVVLEKSEKTLKITLNKKKLKPLFEEAATNAVTSQLLERASRRIYLHHEIKNLVCVFKDSPGLIGPNTDRAACCLSLVKQELLWYFRHNNKKVPNVFKVQKKTALETFKDDLVPEMIYYSIELITVLNSHMDIIQVYHAEFLNVCDYNTLKELVSANSDAISNNPKVALNEILNELSTINVTQVTKGQIPNLEKLRIRIFTVQGLFSSPDGFNERIGKAFRDILMSILLHSRLVDDFPHLVKEFISIGDLFYETKQMEELFSLSLGGTEDQPSSCFSFLHICNMAGYHTHPHCPSDQQNLKEKIESSVNVFLDTFKTKLEETIIQVCNQTYKLDIESTLPKLNSGSHHKEQPGEESRGTHRLQDPVWTMSHSQNVLFRILSEMRRNERIRVNHLFVYPKQILITVLERIISIVFVSKITKQINVIEPPILRPSTFLDRFQILIRVCQMIHSFIEIDYETLIRTEFLNEIHDPVNVDTLDKINSKSGGKEKRNLITYLSAWMLEFVKTSMEKNVIYSDWRESFVTVAPDGSGFYAEYFLDFSEINSLVTFLGPYGVLSIDVGIRKKIKALVAEIAEALTRKRSILMAFKSKFYQMDVVGECQKVLMNDNDIEIIFRSLVSMGRHLALRKALFEHLGKVVNHFNPATTSLMKATHEAFYECYQKKFENVEYLAIASGCVIGDTDILIQQTIAEYNTTADHAEIWKCLPTAISMSFFGASWKDANWKFDLLHNAHINSANLLIRAFNCIIATFRAQPKSIVPANPSGVPDEDGIILMELIRMSTFVVLKMKEKIEIDKIYGIKDMIVFLDKIVTESRCLQSLDVEDYLPYSLVRSTYTELDRYTDKTLRKQNSLRGTEAQGE
eukprot:c21526_g1_i1.p1 GENE.c21526_g1_i1~~c21526_g1_i1.p1  ORF type:complete len:1162 (+),score=410.51 c21526_g1_i1:109-3594(+)